MKRGPLAKQAEEREFYGAIPHPFHQVMLPRAPKGTGGSEAECDIFRLSGRFVFFFSQKKPSILWDAGRHKYTKYRGVSAHGKISRGRLASCSPGSGRNPSDTRQISLLPLKHTSAFTDDALNARLCLPVRSSPTATCPHETSGRGEHPNKVSHKNKLLRGPWQFAGGGTGRCERQSIQLHPCSEVEAGNGPGALQVGGDVAAGPGEERRLGDGGDGRHPEGPPLSPLQHRTRGGPAGGGQGKHGAERRSTARKRVHRGWTSAQGFPQMRAADP